MPIIFNIFSQNIFASSFQATGKHYYNSCSNATSILGQLNLTYNNPDLVQPGARVFLHYGLSGFLPSDGKTRIEWKNINDVEMTKKENYNWSVNLDFVIHTKSYNYYYDSIPFVFLIVYQDGSVRYDNSGKGIMSFYEVSLPKTSIYCSASLTGSDIASETLEQHSVAR